MSLMRKDIANGRDLLFDHCILQVNFEEQCQTYLEPPYDEIFAAHIRYIHFCIEVWLVIWCDL